jgi:hypothetical protein
MTRHGIPVEAGNFGLHPYGIGIGIFYRFADVLV